MGQSPWRGSAIRRRISLNRESYKIVGVMPSAFYPAPNYPELWAPRWASQAEKDVRNVWGLFPLAQLKPGVTWQQVQTELDVISARVLQDHPTLESVGGTVVPWMRNSAASQLRLNISRQSRHRVSQDGPSPAAFPVSSLFLYDMAICASYRPARRASRVDAMAALQHD